VTCARMSISAATARGTLAQPQATSGAFSSEVDAGSR
jgi:hypothetical protein